MDKTQSLNKIYTLYSGKKYSEAKQLNDQVLQQDPNNIYAKRYQSLLEKKIKQTVEPERKGPIPTVSGKSLKCPHCVAKIALSGLTQGQKDRIRNKDLDNLEIKCPYCHTEFMLQKKTAKSLLGIKLGEKITYKQKSYRTTGYIEYEGLWYEGSYSGKVYYLEWILLGDDNSYLYFSEGYSVDDGQKVYEFDFSHKTIPKTPMSVDFENKTFSVSGVPIRMKEYSKIKVKSAYGENAKSFKIGEEVTIAPTNISGDSLVYEKESSGIQTEVGIYSTNKVSISLAKKIFNKTSSNKVTSTSGSGIINKLLLLGILGPIFMYIIIIPITSSIIEKKEQVHIDHLETGKKIELNFSSGYDKNKSTTSTSRYDYGGVRTYYKENTGIKFSIQTQEDIDLIEKIKENKSDGYNNLSENEEKINTLFEGNLYKLK